MKKLIVFLLSAAASFAQAGTVTLTGPSTVRPGQQVSLTLSTSGGNAAGLQWALTIPTGWTGTAVAGGAATAAGKTLYCNSTFAFCLEVGINQNTIGAGAAAQYTLTVPANAAPGTIQIPLAGLLAASIDGVLIPTTSGPLYTLTVLSKTDLNGDGKTDAADLQILMTQITGGASCSNDQNGDAKCDLVDALILIRGALGI